MSEPHSFGEAEIARLNRELVHTLAVLESIGTAVAGEPVSDFMQSFHPVRAVVDLRDQRDRAMQVVTRLSEGLARAKALVADVAQQQAMPDDSWQRELAKIDTYVQGER